MSAADSSLSGLQALEADATAQALQNSISSSTGATGLNSPFSIGGSASGNSGNFNGTLSDLEQKYPAVYNTLVLQTLAYQIVEQCQDANDQYIEVIKETEETS